MIAIRPLPIYFFLLDRCTNVSFKDAEGWRNGWQTHREQIRYNASTEMFVASQSATPVFRPTVGEKK